MNALNPGDLLARVQAFAGLAARHAAAVGQSSLQTEAEHGVESAAILAGLGVDETAQAAAWLVAPAQWFPVERIREEIDPVVAHLVERMRQLLNLSGEGGLMSRPGSQQEPLRRMLLAMADDIRVVLLFLAWRLQTLRHCATDRESPSRTVSEESLRILAPLANRLGLWQLKWEIEDLAFRFLEPDTYRSLARQLEAKRAEREAFVDAAAGRLARMLSDGEISATVSGRPKHLYSIHRKMQSKGKSLDGILDLRGLRVIVHTIEQCYEVLDVVHQLWPVIESEFDDYIARPKSNGYRSLHTVVTAPDGLPLEVQIRTQAMHEAAEFGLASHWRYKERGSSATGAEQRSDNDAARTVEWVRALLAWQKEVGQALGSGDAKLHAEGAAPVYALTPLGRVIELPAGATPIDFAYHVHSSLGHRCRGARVNGQLVPLNRPLESGQTVEILAAKEGAAAGPSRDWLNPAQAYVASPRARTKIRQWFHLLELQRDQASGRERIEKVLQREGRTTLAFEDLARRLGQSDVASMFVAVAREEIGPRQIEEAVRAEALAGSGSSQAGAPSASAEQAFNPDSMLRPRSAGSATQSGVLIVGVDSLLSQLARCCRPVPPDPVVGFVTRGRGVSVHRADCATLARLAADAPERIMETEWDPRAQMPAGAGARPARFAADIEVLARDRQGLLRDISEVFARDRINVTGAQTLSRQDEAKMRFTIEVADAGQLTGALAALRQVQGVTSARRKVMA